MSKFETRKEDGYKVAPNKLETYRIKSLAEEGKSANEISLIMKIKVESVENWMPKPKKKAKSKEA